MDFDTLFATAGTEPRAAAKSLAQHGVHLTIGKPDGARLRLEVLSLGPWAIHDLEDQLGIPGLAWLSQAIPIDRVEALRAAVRDRQSGYYEDPIAFVGEALRGRPFLERLVRRIVDTVGLGGAAVAPTGSGGVAIVVGAGVNRDTVDPLSRWAQQL